MKILVEATEHGLNIRSDYHKALVKKWVKEGTTLFELKPRKLASKQQTGYLEGAVVPAWGKYQYNLDPRQPETASVARDLFKQDWWFDVIKDRRERPKKVPRSFKNRQREVLDLYTEHAEQNGFPIPNPELYKTWRDEYSMEPRWANYWDWLDYLGLDCDAMPSRELLAEKL